MSEKIARKKIQKKQDINNLAIIDEKKVKDNYKIFFDDIQKIIKDKMDGIDDIFTEAERIQDDIINTIEKKGISILSELEEFKDEINKNDTYWPLIDKLFKIINLPPPDGFVISLSAAAMKIVGVGIGGELVHVKGHDWVIYAQGGFGFGYGIGGSLEPGFIWGLDADPINYTGKFIEAQASLPKSMTISIFGWYNSENKNWVWGLKGGVGAGKNYGVMIEGYIRIYDFKEGWFPDKPPYEQSFEKFIKDLKRLFTDDKFMMQWIYRLYYH